MLININALKLDFTYNYQSGKNDISIDRVIRTYINPERIAAIIFNPYDQEDYGDLTGYVMIWCAMKDYVVSHEDGERILAHINGATDALPDEPEDDDLSQPEDDNG